MPVRPTGKHAPPKPPPPRKAKPMPIDYVMYSEYPLGATLEAQQAALGSGRYIYPFVSSPSDSFLASQDEWVAGEWNAATEAARLIPLLLAVPVAHRTLFLNYPMHAAWDYSDPAAMLIDGLAIANWRAWFMDLCRRLAQARATPSRVIYDQERGIDSDIWDSDIATGAGSPGFSDAMADIYGSPSALLAMIQLGATAAPASQLSTTWYSTDPFSEQWLADRDTYNEMAAVHRQYYERKAIVEPIQSHFPNCRVYNFGDRPRYGFALTDSNDRTVFVCAAGGNAAPVCYLPAYNGGDATWTKAYRIHRRAVAEALNTSGPLGTLPVYPNPTRGTNEYSGNGSATQWKNALNEDFIAGVRRSWLWNPKPLGVTAPQRAIIEADELAAAAAVLNIRTNGEAMLLAAGRPAA